MSLGHRRDPQKEYINKLSHNIRKDPSGWMYSHIEKKCLLAGMLFATKQNEFISVLLQKQGREVLKTFPAVLRQQMENELYSTDCC